jgi:hypothetical protein
VFGPLSFWVTEIKNLEELGNPNAGVSSCGQGGSCLAVPVAVACKGAWRAMQCQAVSRLRRGALSSV